MEYSWISQQPTHLPRMELQSAGTELLFQSKKLDPRSQPFNFVGIDDITKGYCYWNGWQILTSHNVIFSKDDQEILNYEDFKVTVNHPMEIEGENSIQSDNLPSDDNPDENNDENINTNSTTITETPKASKNPIPE